MFVMHGQTAGWTKMPLGMEVGLGPDNFLFDGDAAIPRKKAHPPPPNFWPMSIRQGGHHVGHWPTF